MRFPSQRWHGQAHSSLRRRRTNFGDNHSSLNPTGVLDLRAQLRAATHRRQCALFNDGKVVGRIQSDTARARLR